MSAHLNINPQKERSICPDSDSVTTIDTDIDCPDKELADSAAHLNIDWITRHSYSLRTRMPTSKTIRCPYPNVEDLPETHAFWFVSALRSHLNLRR
ncbi:hypothetical protein BDR07DRAFT_1395533 [Suillus spraguei]|nr:hypothetical protein BDR07DRAFT_1395533 [Suillus spraguei]